MPPRIGNPLVKKAWQESLQTLTPDFHRYRKCAYKVPRHHIRLCLQILQKLDIYLNYLSIYFPCGYDEFFDTHLEKNWNRINYLCGLSLFHLNLFLTSVYSKPVITYLKFGKKSKSLYLLGSEKIQAAISSGCSLIEVVILRSPNIGSVTSSSGNSFQTTWDSVFKYFNCV